MFGKSLPRRTVLKGIGTTLALPFLDAMLPPLRAAVKPIHRFQAFYVPNGMAMEYWTPKGESTALELNAIMQPLAAYKDKMLVFSGIKASWNYIHAGASGSFLTGTPRGGRTKSKSSPMFPLTRCWGSTSPMRPSWRRWTSVWICRPTPARAPAI